MIGFHIGGEYAEKCVTKSEYIRANFVVLALGVVVSAIIWMTGLVMLAFCAIGFIAGGIAGLKMGFGESVGPWKVVDRFLHINKDQLEVANDQKLSKKMERKRRLHKEGGSKEEFISTISPDDKQAK